MHTRVWERLYAERGRVTNLEGCAWGKGRRERSGQSRRTGCHSPDVATYEAEHYTDKLDNLRGKKTRQLNPRASAARGGRWGHVPKAQGLKCRGWGSRPCNREGARGGGHTDRQTFHPL